MNVERLHAICFYIKADFDESNMIGLLQKSEKHLQQMVNNPQDPAPQQNLSNTLSQLYEKLSDSYINTFSPAWIQILKEIEGDQLLGPNLSKRIKDILGRNEITPSLAHQEFNEVLNELKNFSEGIENIIKGFDELNIGSEELEPGECEVGVVIPRAVVNNKLDGFGKAYFQHPFFLKPTEFISQ